MARAVAHARALLECVSRILVFLPILVARQALSAQRVHVSSARSDPVDEIKLVAYDFISRARHVCEKAGFAYEGTGRDALLSDDRWIDVHYLAILAR